MRLHAAVAALAVLAPNVLPNAQGRRCQLQIDSVERQGVYSKVSPDASNYFAGGNVRLRCRGQNVRIWTDSVASYQGQVVQFIGNFRYQDETAKVTSDFGTYYRGDERWEARGNVVYTDRRDGSELRGPAVNYYRKATGIRSQEEATADQRPKLTLAGRDSAGRPQEPYVVVADRLKTRGQDLMWAAGNVTIDRSDLRGRSDSLFLDNGKAGAGALIGHASIRRAVSDSFKLEARRIDLGLTKRELSLVTGRDSATLTSKDLDLSAEAVRLQLEASKVTQTLAWGKKPRPVALSDDYEVRGDSLAVDTPEETLRELRAFGRGWVGFRPDSVKGQRDWLEGGEITAEFRPRPVPGSAPKPTLYRIEAVKSARSFYRIASTDTTDRRPSINYSLADRIVLTMQLGDSLKVDRVQMMGNVSGVQVVPDTAKRDTTRRIPPGTRPGRR